VKPITTHEHLDKLLDVLCFKRDLDRINFLGFLLTPFLGMRFAGGRPIATFRGNQPSIGKTTAGQLIAIVNSADDRMLSVSYKRNDEELEKCIASVVRQSNMILIDNVNDPSGRVISSPSLERTITLPTYNFRRVGTSETITGPNYLQFVITFNGGKMCVDLTTRSVFLLMEFEGDPRKRNLPDIGDPADYARANRTAILGELLGKLMIWLEKGRPLIPVACRFRPWSSTINGILTANGIMAFFRTHLEDAREDDELQMSLIELAHAVPSSMRRPSDWLAECLRLNYFVSTSTAAANAGTDLPWQHPEGR